jgi:hypothetical protein
MANLQVFPSFGIPTTMVVNGRTYTCAIGSAITVPDFDAFVLIANGWLMSASDGAGTTANRPVASPATGAQVPHLGYEYFDTTLGVNVIWNGKNWVSHVSGAIV